VPEIYIHAVEGRSLDQKRALVRDITAAVVRNFNVTADSVMVQIIESSKETRRRAGSVQRTIRRRAGITESLLTSRRHGGRGAAIHGLRCWAGQRRGCGSVPAMTRSNGGATLEAVTEPEGPTAG
jgi:4-oxalocrotonate tautomerase